MPRRRASNTSPEQVVQRALNETAPGAREHEARIRRYDKAYRIWRGTTEKPASSQPAWQSRMRVKYGMQVVDQTMVNVVQGAPKALCTPRRPQDVGAAKAMEQILGYFADLDHLAEHEPTVVQQALVYGVSPAKNVWLYRERDVVKGWNPMTDQWDPAVVTVVQDDRPSMIPWDVYGCWWDPIARDPDRASYIVLEDFPTKDELEGNRVENGGMLRNLDLLYQSGSRGGPEQTSAQNQLLGQQQESYEGRYRRWEVWRDNRLTVIGNKTVLLYDGAKPYWMPGKPVVIGNSRPDFLRIEGISETELVDDIQQALWTHENLVMENLKLSVMRGATYRETVPNINALVLKPNYMWPVTDHDDVQFQNPPPLPREAYEQRSTLLGAMQYVTGITPYVTGAVGQGVDQNTATGVSVLNNAASKLLEFKARMIALKVYQRTYEQWKDLSQQYVTRDMSVRVTGGEWQTYGPQDIAGDYDVRVQAGEESLNRQQKRAEAVALLNALAPFAQFGLNVPALLKRVADAYGFESPEELFVPQRQVPSASPQGQLPQGPVPNQNLNGELVPQPAMASIMGNAR